MNSLAAVQRDRQNSLRVSEQAKALRDTGFTLEEIKKDLLADGASQEHLSLALAEIRQAERRDRREETSPENGKHGGRPAAPPPDTVARLFAEQKLTMPNGFLVARHYRDEWFRFADGWHGISFVEMEKTLATWLQDNPELSNFAKPHYVRAVLMNLASFNFCGIDATVEKPCWLSTNEPAHNWVAFSNGIAVNVWQYADQLANGIAPKSYTRPVTPDLFSADFVNYPWDETAFPERFISYLERVQPETENFNAIRRMLGLLIADTGKYEVFFQLYGRGANGKTVLLDIIEALVGRRNVSRVPLEALAPGTRFQSFPLVQAKVNICGELSTDLGRAEYTAVEGQLKHAVSGGTIEIERKGKDKTEERCRARFVLCSNSLPTFFDRSDAIWRRLRVIPFDVQIPESERNPDLAQEIIRDELPGVMLWALDGLAEIIKLGRVQDCPAGQKIKDAHRGDCDHERTFLLDTYEPGDDGDRIASTDVYTAYRQWIENNGYRPLGAGKFNARLEDVFPSVRRGSIRLNGEVVKGITGIKERNVTYVTAP